MLSHGASAGPHVPPCTVSIPLQTPAPYVPDTHHTLLQGYCLLDVTLHARGGHSSMPPTDGSDILSQAARLSTALARQQAWWASASGRGRVSGSGGGSRGRSSKDGGARLRPPVSHMLHALGEVASNRSAVLAALLSASEAW